MHRRPLGALVGATTALLPCSRSPPDRRPPRSTSSRRPPHRTFEAYTRRAWSCPAPAGASPSEFESSPDLSLTDESHSLDAGAAARTASDTAVESTEPQTSGSVAQTTEDGIAIAALSEEMALPDDAPAIVGLVYDQQSDVEFEVRIQQDGEWSDWSHIHVEDAGRGNPGTDPHYVVGAESLQVRILGDDWDPSGTRILLVDPKTKASDAEAVRDNQPLTPPAEAPTECSTEVPLEAGRTAGHTATAGHAAAGGNSATATNTSASVEKVDKPTIRSRKDWGADEEPGGGDQDLMPEVAED